MNFLQENWFYIVAIISLVAGFGTGIFKIGKWIGATNTNIENLKKGVDAIQDGVKTIQEDIKKLFGISSSLKTAHASSPLNLNDLGQEISDHVDAENWAINNVQSLLNQVKGKEEFEIFKICTDYVNEKFSNENEIEFNRTVESIAYEHGIDNEQVLMVYRIELRDAILAMLET